MTIRVEIQYASADLFIIEPRADKEAFARKVTCKLCGVVLFDCERDHAERLEVFLHGLKAHFGIQHGIALGTPPSGHAESISSGH